MTINGLHLMLGFIATLACIGWTVDYRRRVTAERQRDSYKRIAKVKSQRLREALDRCQMLDEDCEIFSQMLVEQASNRHPSNVRILKAVD